MKQIYPFIASSYCIAHKTPNEAMKIKKVNQPHSLKEDMVIFAAISCKEDITPFRAREGTWIVAPKRAVKCTKYDLRNCFTHYEFDKKLWTTIRTATILVSAFRKLPRRTSPINKFFTNEQNANQIMHSIHEMVNSTWKHEARRQVFPN